MPLSTRTLACQQRLKSGLFGKGFTTEKWTACDTLARRGGRMSHIHKRFTSDQVRVLLQGYCHGGMDRSAVEEVLGIGKSRFFVLLKEYRQDPTGLSITYERSSPSRLKQSDEAEIETHLMAEKALIDDPSMPIDTYNYSAVRDRLDKRGVHVSLSTIVSRAKHLGCYQQHKAKKG